LRYELHTKSDQSARDHRTSDDRGGANSSRADGGGL
jgi:catalase (peroxidase I)